MPKSIFIRLLAVIILLYGCAGKQLWESKTRFIPEDKKTIYVGMIYNETSCIDCEKELFDELINHFKYRSELQLAPSVKISDTVFKTRIIAYTYEIIDYYEDQKINEKNIRIYLKTEINIQDQVQKKYYFPEGRIIESSAVFLKNSSFAEKEARSSLYKAVTENIESLIKTGNMATYSKYGYEDVRGRKNETFYIKNAEEMRSMKEENARESEIIRKKDEKGKSE